MLTMSLLNFTVIFGCILSLVQGHGYLIDRDLIAKKDGFKFNLHSGSGILRGKGFRSLGCWKDTWIRAIQPLEKRHKLLMDGNYKVREDPLRKCAIAALESKMKLFAIENGGQCLGDTAITSSYKKYGVAEQCQDDGYGGPWSMQVYGFLERRNGGYDGWSSWTKCTSTCGKGIQTRYRSCTHPSPAHGGRDCSKLGPNKETKPCETECLGTEDDELDNSEKTSKPNKSPDSNKASKKSDDTNDYVDDDDDNDDDDDYPDDENDNTKNNSKDGSNKSKDAEDVNEIDENGSDTKSTDDDYKGENKDTQKELTKQYQEQNIAWSTDTPVLKPIQNTVQNGVNKTPLPSTSDKTKSNDEPADDGVGNSQSGSSKEIGDISENGDTMKPQASTVSQRLTGVPPGSTVDNTDNGNEQSSATTSPQNDGLSSLPKTGTSGHKQSDGTNKLAGNTEKNSGQSTDNGARNTGTMENNAIGISNTKPSDEDGNDDETPSTADTETEEMNEHSDGEISGDKSAMKNDATDSSNSDSNAANEKTPSNIVTPTVENSKQNTATPLKDDESSTMEKDTPDTLSNSATTDKDAEMKELNQNVEKTQPSGSTMDDESSLSTASPQKGLPDKQQMKAAQDLLRSRWLSLAKSGHLKPVPAKQPDSTAKPGVDAFLKDGNEDDFEDKEMENEEKINEKKVVGYKTDGEKIENESDGEKVEDDDSGGKKVEADEGKVDEDKIDGEKVEADEIDSDEADDQTTDDWKQEEQGRNAEEMQVDEVNDQTTVKGKNEKGKKENGENVKEVDLHMNDNPVVDGSRMTERERKLDDQKMNEDSSQDDKAMNAPIIEKHEKPSIDIIQDNREMEEKEEKVNGNLMNEKMSQENGAKRLKEECICPALDLMGKPGPNTKICPCLLDPSKKTSPAKKPDEMTKQEYKTGMFHGSSLPKVETSSKPQPTTASGNSDTASPPANSEKPLNSISETNPSTDKLPALKTSPETTGSSQPAPLLAPDKTPAGNQQVITPSLPATQPKPAVKPDVAATAQTTQVKPNNKVIHIEHNKLNPLSKTLSRLGEKLNKAHAEGDLKEGSFALDNDIQNLLKTIGKLKSQVDNLRNDQVNLGKDGDEMLSSSQSGTSSESPTQSHGARVSHSQSPPASTSQSTHSSEYAIQSQSSTVNESYPNKELANNTLLKSGHMPLKLRIVAPRPNKQQKNVTILNLRLSDKIRPVRNKSLGTSLVLKPATGKTDPVATNSVAHDTTLPQSNSSTPTAQTVSITAPPKPPSPIQNTYISLNSKESTSQNKNLASGSLQNTKPDPKPSQKTNLQSTNDVQSNTQQKATGGNVKVGPSANLASGVPENQPQVNTAVKEEQEDIPNAGANTGTKPALSTSTTNAIKVSQPSNSPPQTSSLKQENKDTTEKSLPSQPTSQITLIPHSGTTYDAKANTITPQSNTLQNPSPPKVTNQISPIIQNGTTPKTETNAITKQPNTIQTPLPSTNANLLSPQIGTKTGNAELQKPNTQNFLHESTILNAKLENTPALLPNTRPNVPLKTNFIKTPVSHKDFAAIENNLAHNGGKQQPVVKSSIPDCDINLGFVLDGSASVEGTRRGNFLKMINFVKDTIHEFVKLSRQVHVGTLVYSTKTAVILSFGAKGTERVVDQLLDNIHYPGQGSLTGNAIKESWNKMFSAVPRGRKSKLILLTDGPSNDDIKMPSKWLRDNGVEIFVIGLGKGYDDTQLRDIASMPSDQHIFYKEYDDLRNSVQEIRNKVCAFKPEEVLQIMATRAKMRDSSTEINAFQRSLIRDQCIIDLVFLLDGSRQVETNGAGNFQREINFVKKAAKYLPLSRNNVHIGVGLLGDSNVMVFPMNEHYSQKPINYELDHIRYPASSDIQPVEIKYARRIMLMKGVRDVAPRVFVLVTDVSSLDSYRSAIKEIRTDGSDIAVFGVGSEIYKQEVKVKSSVAGLVDQVVTLDSVSENEAAKQFAINMCKLSKAKRNEIPRRHWRPSNKILNAN